MESPPAPPSRKKGAWGSLVFVLIVVAAFVTFLLFAPLGRFGIAVIIGGLLFPGIIAAHYFLWGRWISRVIAEETEGEEEKDS